MRSLLSPLSSTIASRMNFIIKPGRIRATNYDRVVCCCFIAIFFPFCFCEAAVSNNINNINNNNKIALPPPPPKESYNNIRNDWNQQQQPQQQQSTTGNVFQEQQRTPIHYPFPTAKQEQEDAEFKQNMLEDAQQQQQPRQFASARRDAITTYVSTKKGRAIITASACVAGMATGASIGQLLFGGGISSTSSNRIIVATFGIMFIFLSFTRGVYGEFVKALALSIVFLIQRTKRIRQLYPTLVHAKSILKMGPRRPFPPPIADDDNNIDDNPWVYKPIYVDDVEFRMLPSLIAMIFVGTICGGSLPIIPSWLGALIGASSFAFVTTMRDSKGDLSRTMGMKVVSLAEELTDINSELELLSKLQVVVGKIFDKFLILDRKHKIKDKITSILQWIFQKMSSAAQQVQADMEERQKQQ